MVCILLSFKVVLVLRQNSTAPLALIKCKLVLVLRQNSRAPLALIKCKSTQVFAGIGLAIYFWLLAFTIPFHNLSLFVVETSCLVLILTRQTRKNSIKASQPQRSFQKHMIYSLMSTQAMLTPQPSLDIMFCFGRSQILQPS